MELLKTEFSDEQFVFEEEYLDLTKEPNAARWKKGQVDLQVSVQLKFPNMTLLHANINGLESK